MQKKNNFQLLVRAFVAGIIVLGGMIGILISNLVHKAIVGSFLEPHVIIIAFIPFVVSVLFGISGTAKKNNRNKKKL